MENKPEISELGKVFDINPSRVIKRGEVTPFIPMEALPEHSREVSRVYNREYSGSGTRFKNGDTLIARITPCLENGKTVFISCLAENVVAHGSTEYIVLSGKQNVSESLYGYYLARSPDFRAYAISHMEGTSGRQRVPASAVENYRISLPPLSDQQAIAEVLGSLDDKIALNRRMNQTLEALSQAIFKSWFIDFEPVRSKIEGRESAGMDAEMAALFPDTMDNDVPSGWKVSTIGKEVNVVGGGTPRTQEPTFWNNGQHHWVTPKDLSSLLGPVLLDTERRITQAGVNQISSGLLPIGTVLLSSRAPIGYIAISEIPVAINQGFIAMICNKFLPNYYVWLWVRENLRAIKSQANGTTFQEISKTSFRPIPVLVPSDKVLNSFVNMITPLYQRMVSNLEEIKILAELRDQLLPKLLSGEVTLDNLENQSGL
jgi:type I restriction enzyme S subunit